MVNLHKEKLNFELIYEKYMKEDNILFEDFKMNNLIKWMNNMMLNLNHRIIES